MDDIQLELMSRSEVTFLHELAENWTSYGPAVKALAGLDGGMTWKTVNGAEYLCRYRQDPKTRKKKFTSLGRRSAETECTYDDFIDRREAAKKTVLANRDAMATAGRVGKAFGFARLPAQTADIISDLWLRSLDEHIWLFGGGALLAYEIDAEVRTPNELVRDQWPVFIFDGHERSRTIDTVADVIEDVAGEQPRVAGDDRRIAFRIKDVPVIEFLEHGSLEDRVLEPDEVEVLSAAFDLPRVKGLTMARDGRVIELAALDPRTYALMAHVLGRDDALWAKRSEFAATLVRQRWPEKFDWAQEAALSDLLGHSDFEEEGPRFRL